MRSLVYRYLALLLGALLSTAAIGPGWSQGTTQPQLFLTQSADRLQVEPGGEVTFTLLYINGGPGNITGVAISDTLPPNTTLVAASNGAVASGNTVFWSLGSLASRQRGTVSLRLRADPILPGGTSITNSAQMSSVEAPAGVTSNSVTVTVASAGGTVSPASSLLLTLAVDRPTAAPGDILSYTVTVTNNSGSAVNQAAVFAPVPAGTQFVDASNGGTLSGDTVVWAFDSLAPGTGSGVAFRVQVVPGAVAGTLLQTQAQLAIPAQGAIVSSNVVTTTVAPPGSQLTLAMTVDRTTARPGDPVTYTLTYANVGPTPADGVAILDPLPAGLNFLGAQANVQIDVATRTLRFNIGSVAAGAAGSISFQAAVDASAPAGSSITNQAQIIGANLTQPVASSPVTIGVVAASAAGTYKLILRNPADLTSFVDNPTSITVDPQSKFTVATIPGDKQTPSLGAQGSLRADGSFDVTTASGRVRFVGRLDLATQTATVTVQRAGLAPYTVVLPRALDFAPLPDMLVGTFIGFATNAAGDQLRVRMTIDPVGNSTFDGDLIQLFPVNLRWRVGSYQVTPDGQLGFGGQTDGVIQPSGNSLVLVYNFTGDNGYQSTFQVPLARQ